MSSAGNTRGLIEATSARMSAIGRIASSAGNTRGLIEALADRSWDTPAARLPRGIPAASLKLVEMVYQLGERGVSSAGNTRGLIEALASLLNLSGLYVSSAGNTRGLIEASWRRHHRRAPGRVFRGEYPRPH